MTGVEWISIGVGLAMGYWLVTAFLSGGGSNPERDAQAETEEPEGATRFGPAAGAKPWYEVLGVSGIATREEISAAYKRCISQYHPDKVANMGAEIRAVAERKSKEINAAYEEGIRRFR